MAKYAITADKSRWKYEKFVVVVRLPRTTLNVAISNLVPRDPGNEVGPFHGVRGPGVWKTRGLVVNAGSGGKRVVRWKTRDLVENAWSGGKRVNFLH